jgi:glutathione S-transferase
VPAKLYWQSVSHPSLAARKMLELKGVEFTLVDVLPLNQRLHLRLAGFRGGTVPALKLDGRRIQGSREIARALDEAWPEPPLVPSDPELRARVLEAERWGEQVLQPVPRRLARFGVARDRALRRWWAERQSLPVPGVTAVVSGPVSRYYARTSESDGRRADEPGVRADLAAVPALLDHADGLLADGTLATDPPNAATLQVLASIRLLAALEDLRPYRERPSVAAARALFPHYPEPIPPFLPPEWLP